MSTSSSGARASVHMLTNGAGFPNWGRRLFLGAVKSSLDHEALPTLLHEVCHHWCFYSPVVGAMSSVYLDAVRKITAHDDATQAAVMDIAGAHARCAALRQLLRPLIEGLALFAEFDALPDKQSRIQSAPMDWLMLLSSGADWSGESGEPTDSEVAGRLRRRLVEVRISEVSVERKTDLLLQPFDVRPDAGEGYLPGYMAVRNIRARQLKPDSLLQDTDFLLTYLRAYFFDDLTLMRLVSAPDPRLDVGEQVAAIANRVHDRFANVFTTDLRAQARQFEDDVLALHTGAERSYAGLLLSDDEIAAGKAEIARHEASLDEPDARSGSLMAAWLMLERTVLKFFELPVALRWESGQLGCFDGDAPFFFVDLEPPADPPLGGAALFLAVPRTFRTYLAVVAGSEVLLLRPLMKARGGDESELSIVRSRARSAAMGEPARRFDELVARFVANIPRVGDVVGALLDDMTEFTFQEYAHWGIMASPDQRSAITRTMRERGFRGLFGSVAEVADFAALSQFTSLAPMNVNVLASVMKRSTSEVQDSVNAARAVHTRHGLHLLGEHNDLFAAVF